MFSRYVRLRSSFPDEKSSAVKSETGFSREAIEHKRGKVLKENFIIGRTWSSAKLFIMQDYTDNANGNGTLAAETSDIFSFSEFKARTCSFTKENKVN